MTYTIAIDTAYLIAAVLFIFGLKGLSHPRHAVRGNLMGSLGMLLAVVITLIDRSIISYEWIAVGIAVGSLIGLILAVKIHMTAMPQLVALFNGFGGAASVLVASVVLYNATASSMGVVIAITASALVGSVTFWGSLVAFAKLQGIINEKALRFKAEHVCKCILFLAVLALAVFVVLEPAETSNYWYLVIVASLLGIFLVMPIGGADMPVVIALLNSYSGIAAAATGFVLNNSVLIIAGSLVGASGIILTRIMCKAMNSSLTAVLFGFGAAADSSTDDDIYSGKIKSTSADEVAMLLKTARRVVFVPGYGMAVAQAQAGVRQLSELMEADGVIIEFGIHPVAGRMPGHMNVLLAEENISYEKLRDLDQINATLPSTDVAIVLGANDVVNPLARESSGTPISGMPILNVDRASSVVVIKRSLSPGFAGIPNPLFSAENSLMLFGDGKKVMEELIVAYKDA